MIGASADWAKAGREHGDGVATIKTRLRSSSGVAPDEAGNPRVRIETPLTLSSFHEGIDGRWTMPQSKN